MLFRSVLPGTCTHRGARRPAEDVEPAVLVASPDTNFAFVADFEDKERAILATSIARPSPGLADDDPVAAARRTADLVEGGGHEHIRQFLPRQDANADELSRPARREMIAVGFEPGDALRLVRPCQPVASAGRKVQHGGLA